MVKLPAACGRQALMLGDDGTILKVNGVLDWAFALLFYWSSELERLEAPAAFALISTMALSTNMVRARRLRPLNKRDNEMCM